jgi:microsomal dipeptidase-like Zn-dependent dipeptidase
MRRKLTFLSCIFVTFAVAPAMVVQAAVCDGPATPDPCQGRLTYPLGIPTPCGCHGQLLCTDGDQCDPGYRVMSLPVIPFYLCEYSGYSLEPTTNSTVVVPPQSPNDLWGWADIHEHQFANLAYGGAMFPGSVFDARGVNAALAWCDYSWDFPVWTPNLGAPDLGLPDPSIPVLPYFTWGHPIHGSMFASPMPPFIPLQEIYGFTNNMATKDNPFAFHLPGGTGPFDGWPSYKNGGHQQMYHKWLERAYEGGMRLLVNVVVDNEVLCELSFRREGFVCNDMISAERQINAIHDLEAFIDQQCGQPGCGWYRIATSPQEAREIISSGKMAVIIGMEVDSLFNCKPNATFCDETYIRGQLDYYYGMDLRYIFPIHLFDNRFAGAAIYGDIFAYASFFATGEAMETWDCFDEGYLFKINPFDLSNPLGLLYAALAALWGEPVFDQGQLAHCNAKGLTPDGEMLLDILMEYDMLIDIDHLSARALDGIPNAQGEKVGGALDIFEDKSGQRGYTYPVVSGHPVMMDDYDPIYDKKIGSEYTHTVSRVKRIRDLGGVASVNMARDTCGTTREFVMGTGEGGTGLAMVKGYNAIVDIMDGDPGGDGPFYGEGHPAIALISDMGAFLEQTGPRFGPDGEGCHYYNPNEPRLGYPFPAFDGSGEFCKQTTGGQTFDFNVDGLAHIGLMPDLLADVRTLSESGMIPEVDLDPLFNSAETFVRMWERVENCTPDEGAPTVTCPPDISLSGDSGGTEVFYDEPEATDLCDKTPVVTTDIPSGSVFPTGVTTVTATATDDSGNIGTCTFDVSISCFGVHHLKVMTRHRRNNRIDVKGTFWPAAPFDPMAADLSYWIDDNNGHEFEYFIPAGSFRIEDDPALQQYIFHSPPGVRPRMRAKLDLLEGTYQFSVRPVAGAADIVGSTLSAGLLVEGDSIPFVGQETVVTRVKKNHLLYNARPKLTCTAPEQEVQPSPKQQKPGKKARKGGSSRGNRR